MSYVAFSHDTTAKFGPLRSWHPTNYVRNEFMYMSPAATYKVPTYRRTYGIAIWSEHDPWRRTFHHWFRLVMFPQKLERVSDEAESTGLAAKAFGGAIMRGNMIMQEKYCRCTRPLRHYSHDRSPEESGVQEPSGMQSDA